MFLKTFNHNSNTVSIITGLILLVLGTIIFYALEHNNRYVMASDTLGGKILKSAFQSTTLRTAGFSSSCSASDCCR